MAERTCSIDGCERPTRARGLCLMHWKRWRNTGDAGEAGSRRQPNLGRTCALPDCEQLASKRGLCNRHYIRARRHGSPTASGRAPVHERFWAKVDKNGPVPTYAPHLGNCWLWTGAKDKGYGKFKIGARGTPTVSAYCWSFEQVNGEVPAGLELDHLCRVPACVRPDHLEPVTHEENVLRAWKARRS